MRLANGLFIEKEATFGSLRFSALRREGHEQDEDGMPTNVIKERTYDLKSETQGRMIQVSIPASVPLRDYEYNAEVDMVNPVVNTIAHATFGNNADVDWYIKAEDIGIATQQADRNTKSLSAGRIRFPRYRKCFIRLTLSYPAGCPYAAGRAVRCSVPKPVPA